MPHLLALATPKKVDQTDMSSEAYLRIVYDALSDMSDCAVALGLRDLRNGHDSPFFPQIATIRHEAKFYDDHFNDMANAYSKCMTQRVEL